jgi:DNA repair protein RecO (recombination protein O)
MELHTDEAYVLDVRPLQDADRIVSFLTRRFGKKDGVAKGARRKHSRHAGQLQPLARVSLTWVEKPGRDLVRLSDVELVAAAGWLQQDLEGILLGAYWADQVGTFVQENESGELHFRLLSSTLKAVEEGADRDLASRFFEVWILRLAGIFPIVDACSECERELAAGAVFPPAGEALLCADCGAGKVGALPIEAEVLAFLQATAHVKLAQLAANPPATTVLRRVEQLVCRLRRDFLQQELRSYRVLQETLGTLGDR